MNYAGHPQNYTHLRVGGVPTLLHIKSLSDVQCRTYPLQKFGFSDSWGCIKTPHFHPRGAKAGTSLPLAPLYLSLTPPSPVPSWKYSPHLPQ